MKARKIQRKDSIKWWKNNRN